MSVASATAAIVATIWYVDPCRGSTLFCLPPNAQRGLYITAGATLTAAFAVSAYVGFDRRTRCAAQQALQGPLKPTPPRGPNPED